MLGFELTELDQEGNWRAVLGAYRAPAVEDQQAGAEFDGWITRVAAIDGFESDRLSRVHARLIAGGLLKFQLSERDAALQYQLSPEGRRALESGSGVDESPDEADGDPL